MVRVRPATIDDVPAIRDFIYELSVYEKLAHEMTATVEDLRRTLFGEKPRAEILFLEEDDKKAAFALFFHNYSTFLGKPGLYLEDLFVKPEYRRRGYGKVLLVELAKLAVERGCGRMEWAVLDWNTPAIKFYESLGAIGMTEWTTYRVTGNALTQLAGLDTKR